MSFIVSSTKNTLKGSGETINAIIVTVLVGTIFGIPWVAIILVAAAAVVVKFVIAIDVVPVAATATVYC